MTEQKSIEFNNVSTVLDDITRELKEGKKARRNFPDHIAGMAGFMTASAGQVMIDSLELKYGEKTTEEMKRAIKLGLRIQLVRTAALCIRMIENL